MIAVVTEAGRSPSENGSLTVIDPPLATSDERRKPNNQEAAYWSHYARIASAAGLFRLAAFFASRAAAVSSDLGYETPRFPERLLIAHKKAIGAGDSLVGIQWPLQRSVTK
ncbi:MAG TPA: hypothetical protein PK954_09200, partial [Anaerolineales bacterium]|nr:hypothetical protein [Anaerolineales bacterium]